MDDDELKQTVKIQVARKVGTDSRGHSVWTKPVVPVELELVSTVMLKGILASDDQGRKDRLRLVSELNDGLLARNTTTLEFEVLSTDELEEALKAAGKDESLYRTADVVLEPLDDATDADELSLVSTQMLRRLLGDSESDTGEGDPGKPDEHGGFNPYNKS